MLQGDLPWYLTLKPDENRTESGQTRWLHMSLHDGGAYSQEQLCQMAETRETMWLKLCAQNKIPEFLIRWQTHVRSLTMFDKPSYGYLKDLLQLAPAPSQPTEQDTEPSVSTDAEPTAAEAAVPTKAKRSRPSSVAEDAADVKKQKIETHAPEE